MDASECPKPDPQNFVQLSSVADELNKTPELDNKFRHLVPPAVRQMQDELKNILQQIIDQEFGKITQFDDQMNTFLK